MQILLIALGGIIGLLSRYLLSEVVTGLNIGGIKYSTIIVNLIGCFVMGIFWQLAEAKIIDEELRKILMVGFLGCMTTFSSYALETLQYWNNSEYAKAIINVLVSNVFGIVFIFLGYYLMKAFIK